jgi:hypothetical protein
MFGNVWHQENLREFQPKIMARPEKAAHYTQRFAVLQQSAERRCGVRKTSASVRQNADCARALRRQLLVT